MSLSPRRCSAMLPVLLASCLFLASQPARAGFGNLDDLSLISQDDMDTLLTTVGEGIAHKSYTGAASMGLALGFELGADVTAIMPSDEFKDLVASMSAGGGVPSLLLVPRLHFRKGLPMGIDLGFAILPTMGEPGEEIGTWAVEAQWAPISMGNGLNLAGRLSYGASKVSYFDTSTFAVDAVASFKAGPAEPYIGGGVNFTTAEMDTDGAATPLPASVDSKGTYTNPKFYFGLSLKMAILKVVGQYDINGSGNNSFGLRAALSF